MHVPIPHPTPLYYMLKGLLKTKKGVQKTVQLGSKPMRLTWRTYIEESIGQQVPRIPEGERYDGKMQIKNKSKS